jgi:hypothetical protein
VKCEKQALLFSICACHSCCEWPCKCFPVFQTYDMSTDSGHGSTQKQTMSKSTTKQSCWMPRFVYKTKNGKRFHFPTLKTSVLHLWHLWFMNLRGHRYKRTMSKKMFGLNGKPCFVFRNQNTSLIL